MEEYRVVKREREQGKVTINPIILIYIIYDPFNC